MWYLFHSVSSSELGLWLKPRKKTMEKPGVGLVFPQADSRVLAATKANRPEMTFWFP